MRILSFPEESTPPQLRQQVLDLQDEVWPPGDTERRSRGGHDPALSPLSMLLVDGETVVASLDVLFKEIEHAGDVYRAAGLSTVVSRQVSRGHGHGLRLVVAAREQLETMPLDLVVFTCDRPLKGFYERAGFGELEGTVLVGGTPAQPFPSDRPGFDKVTLAEFLSPRARSREALFRGARIGLYPGETDKLW